MTLLKLAIAINSHRATTLWAACGSVAILVIVVFLAVLGGSVAPIAFASENSVNQLQLTSIDQISEGNSSLLRDLQLQVDQTRAKLELPAGFARWGQRFSPAISWLPIVNKEMGALAVQIERAKEDLETASVVLNSSSQLLTIYNNSQTALVTPGASASITQLKNQAVSTQLSFDKSVEKLIYADANRSSTGVILQAPRLRGLTNALRQLEDEMLAASRVGYEVSSMMIDLFEVADAMQPLLNQFTLDESSQGTVNLQIMENSLEQAIEHAVSARQKSNTVAKLVVETGRGEQFLPRLDALDKMLDALILVNNGALIGLGALGPAVQGIESSEEGFLSSGGLLDVFDSVESRRAEIDTAIDDLKDAQSLLQELSGGGQGIASAGLFRLSDAVTDLQTGLELVSNISPVANKILAQDGVKKYLVLGQSADEIRGTGGFVSSMWMVTFQNGGIDGIQYFDAVRVDDWDRLEYYPTAPVGLEEHMNGSVWLLRDVSWDPDFPTTARSAADLFRLGQRQEVDGVIAINQWTLLRLVDALGDIPSPDGGDPINSRNLLSTLEQSTDAYGRAYMDLVMQGALEQLNRPISMPRLMGMASSILDTLQANDTMIFIDDPEVQSVISRLGWDGSIPQNDRDYLFVVDSNVGWSKVDRNIQRDITYTVDLSNEARPRAILALGYNNHSGPGSPPCEPQWLSRGTDYSQLKNACYWNYLRVYIPQASRLLSSTRLPLPAQSVSVEVGKGVPGQETGSISSSHNRFVFSGLTTLEAGERSEINLVYDLPPTVVRNQDGVLQYRLYIQKQPGVRERDVFVEVIAPEGYELSNSSPEPVEIDHSRIRFREKLTQNILLDVTFTSNIDDSN